jgi:hypothetical protein
VRTLFHLISLFLILTRFKVLALAAFLAFHLFQKYASTRRRATPHVYTDTPWVTLPRRYLSSYSNRWSPVNGFPSAPLPLMGHLPMPYRWLRHQWPTSRTPEVVDIPFYFSFIVTLLKYPSLAKYFRMTELVTLYPS